MVNAPEKIRVAQDSEGFWTCREAISGSQEYTRSDLVAELAAENERLRNALDGYGKLDAELAIADRRIEALKQEVENWKTSASGWQKLAKVDAEASEIVEDAIRRCRELHDYAGRPAWEKALEDAILSALEPHPRATNIVDSHETANVIDKPEGQQEPVAYGVKASNTMRISSVYLARDHEEEGLDDYRKDLIVPLYTRPSEQVVTEAMVEAACRAHWFGEWPGDRPANLLAVRRHDMRNALKAAMEAGG